MLLLHFSPTVRITHLYEHDLARGHSDCVLFVMHGVCVCAWGRGTATPCYPPRTLVHFPALPLPQLSSTIIDFLSISAPTQLPSEPVP